MDKYDELPQGLSEEFYEFIELMKDTTENLKRMQHMQEHMLWQFGNPKVYCDFQKAINDTVDGWVSSHC